MNHGGHHVTLKQGCPNRIPRSETRLPRPSHWEGRHLRNALPPRGQSNDLPWLSMIDVLPWLVVLVLFCYKWWWFIVHDCLHFLLKQVMMIWFQRQYAYSPGYSHHGSRNRHLLFWRSSRVGQDVEHRCSSGISRAGFVRRTCKDLMSLQPITPYRHNSHGCGLRASHSHVIAACRSSTLRWGLVDSVFHLQVDFKETIL